MTDHRKRETIIASFRARCPVLCWPLSFGVFIVFFLQGVAMPVGNKPLRQRNVLPARRGQVFIVDDFDNKTTRKQLGHNYFGGNNGVAESAEKTVTMAWSAKSKGPAGGSLAVTYDFTGQPKVGTFGGVFLSQFGLTDTKIDLKGGGREPKLSTQFPGYFFDTTNLYGDFRRHLKKSRRSVDRIAFDLFLETNSPIRLKVEVKDERGHSVYTYVRLRRRVWTSYTLQFPNAFRLFQNAAPHQRTRRALFDRRLVSLVSFVVEYVHEAHRIKNPVKGRFLVDNLRWIDVDGRHPAPERARGRPEYEHAFLQHVRETSFRYFLDFASTDPRCGAERHKTGVGLRGGIIQDRSVFADLMSIGGVGFQLTAYCIGSERRYISRFEARRRVLNILTALHKKPEGPQRVGTNRYRGFFYHFVGIDGVRKHNFDFTATPIDESMNTIELSPIDTALALCGVVTVRQYFDDPKHHEEKAIRRIADDLLGKVDWPWMLEPTTKQWYLGWKPTEKRDDHTRFGRFLLPDGDGLGHFSSKPGPKGAEVAATIDHYTDEETLISLLAIASPVAKHRVDPAVFFSATRKGKAFVKTYPGALFTYQFTSCWLDTSRLGADRKTKGGVPRIDYFKNTRAAIQECIKYCSANPQGRATLSKRLFGLTACDGVFDGYHADAAPTIAIGKNGGCHTVKGKFRQRHLEVGTVAVYGIGSSIVHTPKEATAGLWECEKLGLLHPRFGFCDAFNLDISNAVTPCVDPKSPAILRTKGRWANFTGFAIDHGPMLILIDNHLEDNFVPKLFMSYPPIASALKTLFPDKKP